MNPLETLRHAFRPAGSASDQHYSMALLEKHHHFLRRERLREAAERAFGHSFAPGTEGYSVTQSTTTFVTAGGFVIHITQSSSPHAGRPHEIETKSADHHLHHHAWQDHRGYVEFEMWGHTHTQPEAYGAMAKLLLELLDENVLAVYLARENDFYPNDGSAAEILKLLATKSVQQLAGQ